ncbi:MAG: outer membrane beta-barrel family protein [Flavobacteriaceae bacterium]|jgi:hypothetical protein|nr:outer membrane beta-barrel family protein [Flavobacteriaceae bacterium]
MKKFILKPLFIIVPMISVSAFAQENVQDSINKTAEKQDTIKATPEQKIQEVEILGQKKLIERKVDRIVFNVENSVAASGGTALDALEKAPQIRVKEDEGISMIGKSSLMVLIDDRQILISGKDLTDYLKSMPADNIKSIEIISNPPAKYDAEGNSGIVNIVLKKAKANSWNANFTENYRQGKYAYNSNSALFNLNKNKLSLSSSVGYGSGNAHTINRSEIFYPDEYWKAENNRKNNGYYFSGKLGLDYAISDKFTIGILYNHFNNKNNYDNHEKTWITGNPDYDAIETPKKNHETSDFNTANLHGIYKIDSIGRKLSVDFNYIFRKNMNDNVFSSSYFLDNQLQNFSKANNLGNQNIENYSVLVDMEHPTKFINWNYGGKLSFSKTDNQGFYYDLISGTPVLDPNNTDHFIYTENNEALYLSANKKFGEKWEAKAGIRMENTQLKGNSLTTNETNRQHYTKLFPTAYLNYEVNENNTLSINYGTRIQRPNYGYLNPFRWYSNPLVYSTGDPNLQPSFTHNFEFSYSHKNLNTTLYYSRAEGDFEQFTLLNANDRTQIIKPYNGLNSNIFGLKGDYNFSKIKWWETYTEFDLHYAEYKALLPFITNTNNFGWGYYFSTDHTFYFDEKKNFAFNINWWYSSKGVDQMDIGSAYNKLDVALKMSFFSKNLSVTLKGNDITGSNRQIWTAFTNHIKNVYLFYGDYHQNFSISVSYKIGNKNIKSQNHNTGNTEEQERL